MSETLKPGGTEEAVNATPKTFGNSHLVRVINTSTGLRLLTIKDVHTTVSISVNTDVNATTLFVMTAGLTDKFKINDLLVNSTNTAVVNTDTVVKVTSIVNSTAFVVNTDIIIANGVCDVGVSSLIANATILGNTVTLVAKNRGSSLHSNNNTDVLGAAVAYVDD